MSFDALAWAGKCQPGTAPKKLVLLALSDRHNTESNCAYPSIAWLAEWTGLNRKTIINALAELEADGFIADSGKRYGNTRQIKAYSLNIKTVPKTELSQKRNSTEKVVKQSQKRDTEPVRTSSSEPKGSSDKPNHKPVKAFPKPDWADTQVWSDFLKNRKAKKCQNTVTAYKRFLADIEKHASREWPPPKLLEHAAAMGWAGIYSPHGRDSPVDARQEFLNQKYG